MRGPVVSRKNYYGSGSVVSAELAGRVLTITITITATAGWAGLNPLAYLRAYLDECARAGGTAPTAEALTRFLPWAASPNDLTAWAYRSRPQTTEPDTTGSDTHPAADPDTGPAP